MSKLVPIKSNAVTISDGAARCDLGMIANVRHTVTEHRAAIGSCDPWSKHHHEKMAAAIQEARELVAADWWIHALTELDQARQLAPETLVRTELATMIAAFPNGAKAELANYGRQLVAHVVARMPSVFAVTSACWKLTESSRFVPTVAEVVAAIDEAEETVNGIWERAHELPPQIESAAEYLANCQESMTRTEAGKAHAARCTRATCSFPRCTPPCEKEFP